jgi:putative membrane protein
MRLRRTAALLVGLGGGAATALIAWAGARQIGAEVLQAGWALPAALALHAVQLLLSAVAWRDVTGSGPGVGAWLHIRWIREAVNSVVPTGQLGGNLLGVRLLGQHGLGTALAAAGTVLDVTLEALTQVLFTFGGLAALAVVRPQMAWGPWLVGSTLLMTLGVAGFVLAQRAGLMRLIELAAARLSRRIPALAAGALHGLHAELMRLQRDAMALTRGGVLHLLALVIGVGESWVMLLAMGHRSGLLACLVIESLGLAARGLGFAVPGGLGVQEGGFVLAGGLLGLPAETAIALSMVKRARELLVGVAGVFAWQAAELGRIARSGSAGVRLRSGERLRGREVNPGLVGQRDPG